MAGINIPDAPFLDPKTGKPDTPWLIWLGSPNFLSVNITSPIPATSGGTGLSASPGVGQILVGNGTSYSLATTLPAAAFPALAGDVSTVAGALVATLATVATPGSFGNGTNVATFTVNAKGLVTAGANAPITGSPGAFAASGAITGATLAATTTIVAGTTLTAVGAFGCNTKAAQPAAAVNAAVAGTAGAAYTATEQTMLVDLKALVNQLRAALVANGVCV